MNRVAIVIPNWNGAARLAKALECLANQTHPIERVIVVDNGSADNSAEVARSLGAHVIELKTNTGFSHAVNRGVQEAGSDWIGIVNNDVWFERNWLECLVEKAEAAQAWFATGKILYASDHNRLDGAFDAICRGGCAWRCGHARAVSSLWNEPRKIRFAPLTAAIVRAQLREIFED